MAPNPLLSPAVLDLGLGADLAQQSAEEAKRLKKLRQNGQGGVSDHPFNMPGTWGNAAAALGLS